MSWIRFATRRRRDEDRADEIDAHLEHAVDHYRAQGLSEAEAHRQARLHFGNARAHREGIDQLNRLPILDVLIHDLRYAIRMFRRTPIFALTVIATLALVIGATTTVFCLAHAILLRALPYPDARRLGVVRPYVKSATEENLNDDVDGAMFELVRDRATTIDVAVSSDSAADIPFVSLNSPSFARAQSVGAGYFRVLGLTPWIGREFSADEDQPGGPSLAVVSYDFWTRKLLSSPTVLGQSILLRGQQAIVIGVMPKGFRGLEGDGDVDVWMPLRLSTRTGGQGTNWLLIARLKAGKTWSNATDELRSFGKSPFRLIHSYLRDDIFATLTIAPMQAVLVSRDGSRDAILMLSAAVGTVLLIACVNIAGLLIARSGSRSKEIATRIALGCGRRAIVRQLMTESALLALAGGSFGFAVGAIGLDWLKTWGGPSFAAWRHVTLDGSALAVTSTISLLTSVAFGLVPALQASRLNVQAALVSGGSRSVAGSSRRRLLPSLIVAEVALGVVLLVAAGLLIRQFSYLTALDPGFNPDHLYTVTTALDARYREAGTINQLFSTSLDGLERQRVTAAAVSRGLPYQRLINLPCDVEGRPPARGNPSIASAAYVTPRFFETLGIRFRQGRSLLESDGTASNPVVVVNEMFAAIFFPGQPAIGKRVLLAGATREIVGISANVQQFGAGFFLPGMGSGPVHTSPTVYMPATQTGLSLLALSSPTWTVRAHSAAEASSALERAIHQADPLLPLTDVRSMAEIRARSTATPRLLTALVGALAFLALLLAAIGLNGLVAYSVTERTREVGVRLALGATVAGTVMRVAATGVALAALGAVIGALLSIPATELIQGSLFTVNPHDAATYMGASGVLCAVAVVASLLPTLRIAYLDPVKTLRE
jgi:predicted permease